ncbi:MAG: sugar ABC transporter permease, partial [Marmoricola sp.]|nr:sugar ABC transporter permease [Marmoricola sp.]
MALKILLAILTVALGIGAAIILYWLLNKLAEFLPSRQEHRFKPYFYILPAYAAIIFFLIYPAVLTVINAFKDSSSTSWVGFSNFTHLLQSHGFQQTLFNTLLWIIIVPTFTVIIGLAVATLADRLNPGGEKFTKTLIFLPMAISFVGAGTIWKLVYAYNPTGDQIGLQNAIVTKLGAQP